MAASIDLLRLLADGEFHSGEALGQALGVTRSAVWKMVRALRREGVDVYTVHGRGYKWARPVELLDRQRIERFITVPEGRATPQVVVEARVVSTNLTAQALAKRDFPAGTVCVAEMQEGGRGRRGRSWHSPFARNIYCSMLWRFERGLHGLGGISLVTGLAVLRTVIEAGVTDVSLKWPNDLYCHGRKLAGVLVDVTAESGGASTVVMGIGINVAMDDRTGAVIDQPWTDLQRVIGKPVSRNQVIGRLISHLLLVIGQFETEGLGPLLEEWRRYDMTYGQPVIVKKDRVSYSGIACGVNEEGALVLSGRGGRQVHFTGEVSLRLSH